jgi:plastocyanin
VKGIVGGLAVVLMSCAPEGDDAVTGEKPRESPAGVEQIVVKAVEYAFQGMPETLQAGRVAIRLENAGTEPHQMSIVRITTDATVEELLLLPEKEANRQIEEAGNLFARPGDSQRRVLDLAPGDYGYVCFVSTKASDGPHAFHGMVGEFTVE